MPGLRSTDPGLTLHSLRRPLHHLPTSASLSPRTERARREAEQRTRAKGLESGNLRRAGDPSRLRRTARRDVASAARAEREACPCGGSSSRAASFSRSRWSWTSVVPVKNDASSEESADPQSVAAAANGEGSRTGTREGNTTLEGQNHRCRDPLDAPLPRRLDRGHGERGGRGLLVLLGHHRELPRGLVSGIPAPESRTDDRPVPLGRDRLRGPRADRNSIPSHGRPPPSRPRDLRRLVLSRRGRRHARPHRSSARSPGRRLHLGTGAAATPRGTRPDRRADPCRGGLRRGTGLAGVRPIRRRGSR